MYLGRDLFLSSILAPQNSYVRTTFHHYSFEEPSEINAISSRQYTVQFLSRPLGLCHPDLRCAHVTAYCTIYLYRQRPATPSFRYTTSRGILPHQYTIYRASSCPPSPAPVCVTQAQYYMSTCKLQELEFPYCQQSAIRMVVEPQSLSVWHWPVIVRMERRDRVPRPRHHPIWAKVRLRLRVLRKLVHY
jgi:hypothetical protein